MNLAGSANISPHHAGLTLSALVTNARLLEVIETQASVIKQLEAMNEKMDSVIETLGKNWAAAEKHKVRQFYSRLLLCPTVSERNIASMP